MLVTVTLSLQGQSLDPDQITNLLNVFPYRFRSKGDVRKSPSGKEAVAHTGIWEWRTTDESDAISVSKHLNRLESAFLPVLNQLSCLPYVDDALVDIHIVTDDVEDGAICLAFELAVSDLRLLATIGLPVAITVDRVPSSEA